MMGMQRFYSHKGFTLIELVVVMLVIAVIAGATITAFNSGFVDDQEQTAALYEMTQIRDAILQFKQDNPTHDLTTTTRCTPADASFLMQKDYDNDCDNTDEGAIPDWDINYRLGWQGPYIQNTGTSITTSSNGIDIDIGFDGDEATPSIQGTLQVNVPIVLDVYNNPYYFFDLDDFDKARIVSAGVNGDYESYTNAVVSGSECNANGDDLVLCLR